MSQFVEETTVVDSDIPDAAVGTDVAAAETWFGIAVGIAVAVANAAVGTVATAGAAVVDCTVGENCEFAVDDTNVMTDAIVVAAVAEVAVADCGPTVVDDNV